MKKLLIILLLCAIQLPFYAQSQQNLQTESPYFIIENELSDDFNKRGFSLKGTKVDVNISGVIAEVEVTQRYVNNTSEVLDSKYVFPGSTHAAVYAMQMQINDRVIKAEIKEKEEAKQIFEEAKQEGKSASLMQQHRPNVFEMSLANIRPGDEILVTFSYTENIFPRNKIYEFVFPTVVGPRYATEEMAQSDPWVNNPYVNPEHPQHPVIEPTFELSLQLNAGMPINQASWHNIPQAQMQFTSDQKVKGHISNEAYQRYHQDMIFRYQLAGKTINAGLLLYEGEDENFFMYTVQPPARPKPADTPPRDYIFIVDVSGSMSGFPIEVSKSLITDLLANLTEKDRFNIVTFANGQEVYSSKMVPVTQSSISKAISFIESASGYGGTEVLDALEEAFDLVEGDGRSTTMVIATDGFVTVEREAMELISERLNDANFFPFGIGGSSNRYMIEAMANAALSEPFICTTESEAKSKAKEFREMILSPVLTDVEVEIEGIDAYDVIPASIPDVFADKPVVVFGKYKGDRSKAEITVSGTNANEQFHQKAAFTDLEPNHSALRYLWARQKVKQISDYNRAEPDGELKEEIINLGLNYNLMTEFTSFVGVDNERPPLEAHRMNNTTIPTSGGGVPEPHEWTLILLGITLLLYLLFGYRFKGASEA